MIPWWVTNATYSGIAKSAKVIAVKAMADDGCVPYVSSRAIRLTRTSKGLVNGLMCRLLSHETSLLGSVLTFPAVFPEWTGLLVPPKSAVALLLLP